jgi:predicted regulator of Ras-like GTPase activity (Roadblock/LC7/MglB family)
VQRDVARVTWIATVQLGVSIAVMGVVFVQQRGLMEPGRYALPAEWAIIGACSFFLIGIALGGLLTVAPSEAEPEEAAEEAREEPSEPAEVEGPGAEEMLDAARPADSGAFSVLLKQLDPSVGVQAALLSTHDGLSVTHTLAGGREALAASALVPQLVREAQRWRRNRNDAIRRIEVETADRKLWVFAGKGLILSVLVNGAAGDETARCRVESVGRACDRLWGERYELC